MSAVIVTALLMLLNGSPSTTIAVENRSDRAMRLIHKRLPAHYPDAIPTRLAPGMSDRIGSVVGKIMLPHEHAAAEVIEVHYVDGAGNGCHFATRVVRHTDRWAKLKPSAVTIGDAECEARTGSTSGDFVYVVR
jgi:hypothetical protein